MRRLPLLLAILVVPAIAEAQSGVQWTRARDATLVSKDVDAERWAITYRLSDGRATGNVFRTDGGPTSFLDCERTSLVDGTATFDCYGADACADSQSPPARSPVARNHGSGPRTRARGENWNRTSIWCSARPIRSSTMTQ